MDTSHHIQLIVGLGNPGDEYAATRHNAGVWFLEALANQYHTSLRPEKKFRGLYGKIQVNQQDCHLLFPTTFMNNSGQSVQALARFYQIPVNEILVVHDDLDLPVGTIRLKQGGGNGGHNGLEDISEKLNDKSFWRLRIGIAHPGDRSRVLDYVLTKPSKSDFQIIQKGIDKSILLMHDFLKGETQKVIQQLHTQERE